MNDPTVTSLIYHVMHGAGVSYDNATPLKHETEHFKVVIENGQVAFEMKAHCATEEAARALVEPIIRQWEVSAIFDRGPNEFELKFIKSVVVDRNPTPGVITLQPARLSITGRPLSITIGRRTYPSFPGKIAINGSVEAMIARYTRYREDRDTLAAMAYFCLTVLEDVAGNRQSAAELFHVSMEVLKTLGHLTGTKGGVEARKSKGRLAEFSPIEKDWIEAVVLRLIRQAAEIAGSSKVTTLTMANFPQLQ